MKGVLECLNKELRANIDENYKKGCERYFKEKITILGVRTPVVREISRRYFKEIRHLGKEELFSLCEKLLEEGHGEHKTVAFDWAFRFRKSFNESDFRTFESWIERYVTNWGHCDDFCTHVIHYFIESFPSSVSKIKSWSRSENRWFRRASAVSFITTHKSFYVVRHNLDDVFEVAEILLNDSDDLVQKGYGWMLKAASVFNQREVYDFVMDHKHTMPRTAFRYAIEKMPEDMRRKAMEKSSTKTF